MRVHTLFNFQEYHTVVKLIKVLRRHLRTTASEELASDGGLGYVAAADNQTFLGLQAQAVKCLFPRL